MLESLEVRSASPYRDRPYEWVVALARFAVDPAEPANARIVDLDLAPRGPDGRVRFEADVRLLRPTAGGNGKALLVVPNRGMLGGIPFCLDAVPAAGPTEDPDPGDGYLLEEGWTVGWCGWQWDVRREDGWLGLAAPPAGVEPGWMRVEFRPDTVLAEHPLSDSSPLFRFADYPTADPEDRGASLSVRNSPLGQKCHIERRAWRFVGADRVALEGGFQPFHWYELVYRAAAAPVVGTGLLAVRDFASHLRDACDQLFAFGISQSGRFLRQFLSDGLNLDERGRPLFDGVFSHIAGARRGEFNMRYGQPSLTHPLNPGYGPPLDTGGLLARQRALGGVPKLIQTNSSWEYWRGDGALLHQDPRTGEDLPEDPETRTYLIAGTDHFGPFPLKGFLPAANPIHLLDASPVLRALFVQLEQWVGREVEPSASRVPRQAEATAVPREKVLSRFHAGALPDPEFLPWTPAIDPASATWPLPLGEPLVALVSEVDAQGNEVSGIRLPAVAAAVAAYTGWNPRIHVEGLPEVLYEFVGSRLPSQAGALPADRATYGSRARAAGQELVDQRLVLERDLDRVVAEAMTLYDEAVAVAEQTLAERAGTARAGPV